MSELEHKTLRILVDAYEDYRSHAGLDPNDDNLAEFMRYLHEQTRTDEEKEAWGQSNHETLKEIQQELERARAALSPQLQPKPAMGTDGKTARRYYDAFPPLTKEIE